MISLEYLNLYLYASVFFLWGAVAMAGGGKASPVVKVNDAEGQAKTGMALFAMFFILSVAYKIFAAFIPAQIAGLADVLFSAIMIAAVIYAATRHGDPPDSVGISKINIHFTALMIVPIAAVAIFPGGALNWKFLASGVTPGMVITAIALEMLFRGYLQTRLQSAWGVRNGLLATAALATLYQAPMYILSGNIIVILIALPVFFVIWGLVAGLIFNRTGNIFGLVILRILWEVSALVYFGMTID